MTVNFVHLHCHSDRSVLDSITKIPNLVEKVKEFNQPAIAVTDHGVVAGAIQLYKECRKKDIKPIIGAELYLSPTDDHTIAEKIEGQPDYYHINLLAMNSSGVSQLYKLSSLGFMEGFYRKPRVSIPLIEEIGKDLLILGACVKGPVTWNLFTEQESKAFSFARRLKEIFSDRFYLELMDHDLNWQKKLNKSLIELSRKEEIPWIPTNDAHFLEKEDHYVHSLMMCLQLKKTLEEYTSEGKMSYPENCYVRTTEEMVSVFGEEACQKTLEVAEKVNISLDLDSPKFPEYK